MTKLRILNVLLLAPCALASGTVGAQGMTDPTRPPAAMALPGDNAAPAGGPVLQSVMLSPGRKVAVISGEMVVLGGRYGGARLVRLTESEAVLREGTQTTVLRMFPLVEKRMVDGTRAGQVKKTPARTTK